MLASTVRGTICFSDRNPRYFSGCGSRTKLPPPKTPHSYSHCDISTANVLLWRHGTQWRAKLSDYGTANFKKQIMTVVPGALIYRAPEAHATNQTVNRFQVEHNT